MTRRTGLLLLAACSLGWATAANALEWPPLPLAPVPYLLGGQATVVWQWKPAFHSPYQGAHSLQPQTEDAHGARADAAFSLETNQGWFKKRAIKAGDRVQGLERVPPSQE